MSRLRRPRFWFALFSAGAMLLSAAAIALISVLGGVVRGIESLVLISMMALAGAGWFRAYQQRRRARRAEQALEAAHQATAAAALRDSVTGLGNYRLFDSSLRGAFARAQRYGNPFSVLLMELSLPAQFSDHDQTAGRERVLQFITTVLTRSLRDADTVARVSDAGFAVVMPETAADGAQRAWERVREAVAAHWPEHRTWSLFGGTAGYNVDIGSVEILLSEADRRLALEKRRLRAEHEP